jgi:hypothetical protein
MIDNYLVVAITSSVWIVIGIIGVIITYENGYNDGWEESCNYWKQSFNDLNKQKDELAFQLSNSYSQNTVVRGVDFHTDNVGDRKSASFDNSKLIKRKKTTKRKKKA